ncbi:MAG: BPL-N domain-containing protein [Chlamydiota bacterium]
MFESKCISRVNEEELEGQLDEGVFSDGIKTMVIFPGARTVRDWAFTKSLKAKILDKNKVGEILLVGICAGAFFLSQDIQFNTMKRQHDNYLPIFSGQCVGPVFAQVEDASRAGYRLNITDISLIGASTMKVAVSGAGYFRPYSSMQEEVDYKVLARYESIEDSPIAALACTPFKGCFHTLLIGPHFEYEADDLQKIKEDVPDVKPMIPQLEESKVARLKAIYSFFAKLGLK